MVKKSVNVFINLLLIFAILFTSIIYVATDTNYMEKLFEKNNTTLYTGLSAEDLKEANKVLIDYLKGEREDILMEASVNGKYREVFDERETLHMVDVKELFSILKISTIISLSVSILGYLCLFLKNKKLGLEVFSKFWKVFLGVSILVIVLGIMVFFNFQWFWIRFHLTFFNNDLWLLDPNVSVMINMYPLEFFYSCCKRIIIFFISLVLPLFVGSYYINYKKNKEA